MNLFGKKKDAIGLPRPFDAAEISLASMVGKRGVRWSMKPKKTIGKKPAGEKVEINALRIGVAVSINGKTVRDFGIEISDQREIPFDSMKRALLSLAALGLDEIGVSELGIFSRSSAFGRIMQHLRIYKPDLLKEIAEAEREAK